MTDTSPTPDSERVARMRATWQADKPDSVEVGRARTRWLATQTRRRTPRTFPRALVVGAVLFGAAGALAATGTLAWKQNIESTTLPSATTPAPTPAPPAAKHPRRSARPATQPPPAAPEPATMAEPSPLPLAPEAQPRERALPSAPAERARETSRTVSTSAVTEGAGAWQRAAEALRQGDDRQATAALQELTSSSDPYTRDSAALAKAQLDVARGRWDRARPVLERLAGTGATPLLRRRAAEVLSRGP